MAIPTKEGQPEHYLFVIDTDRFAGNFENEMCAYVTGQVGECSDGQENATIAQKEIPGIVAKLEDLVKLVPDEHGHASPASIFPNPRYGNDGYGNEALLTDGNRGKFSRPAYFSVAIFFRSIPDSSLLGILKQRARDFAARGVGSKGCEEKLTIEGFRFLEQHSTSYKELHI